MVALTFPDGARREYPAKITGLDVAKGISPSLAKRTVAMALDGTVSDLADPIEQDAKIEFITRDDPRALELIRHDCAHVLAEAVQTLWPGTQVTIGPVIENGFYYDFFRNQPFTPEDFDAIEKKMREIIARDKPFTKEVWSRDEAKRVFKRQGRDVQGRAGRRHPGGPADQDLQAGRLVRPLPRPAHDLDRQGRQCLQADEGRGRLLARRFKPRDAVAHLRHRLRQAGGARRSTSSRWRKPRSATIASSAARWTCSISRRKAPARCSGIPRLDHLPGDRRLHAPAPQGRLSRGQRAAASRQVAVGDLGPLGLVPREHVHGDFGGRSDRRRAGVRDQADELPGPHPDFQARAAVLSRTAAADGRIRHGAPLRAVRRAARPAARARVHAGRRPRVLHRGADGRGVPQDQRPDPDRPMRTSASTAI